MTENEPPLYEKFMQQISFNGERYSVALPWWEDHPPLPDHFELCYRQLHGLLKRLKQDFVTAERLPHSYQQANSQGHC